MDGKYTMRKITNLIINAIILISIIPLASAFGVTSPYWEDHVLSMKPGETKEIALILQNMVGGEDIKLKAKIADGTDIASLVDSDIYKINFGEENVEVKVKITIPEDVSFGKKYEVSVLFSQIGEEEGGMVEFTTAVGTRIPIIINKVGETAPVTAEVVKNKAVSEFGIKTFLVLLIAAIIFAVLLIIRKKR